MDNPSPYQPAPILPPPQPNISNPSPQPTPPVSEKKKRSMALLPWILVLLLILALVGVYLWQHNKVTTLESGQNNTAASQPTRSNNEYLYLYDYGIKIPLTNQIRDLYYVSLRSQDINGDELSFSSETLTNEDVACSAEPVGHDAYYYTPVGSLKAAPTSITGAPLGLVSITTSPLPNNEVGATDQAHGTLVAHVKNLYLYYKASQSSCISNMNAEQTQLEQKADLQKALKLTSAI